MFSESLLLEIFPLRSAVRYQNWLVVWNINFIFPYIGNNHPNWLIFFQRGSNHQLENICGNIYTPKATQTSNSVLKMKALLITINPYEWDLSSPFLGDFWTGFTHAILGFWTAVQFKWTKWRTTSSKRTEAPYCSWWKLSRLLSPQLHLQYRCCYPVELHQIPSMNPINFHEISSWLLRSP